MATADCLTRKQSNRLICEVSTHVANRPSGIVPQTERSCLWAGVLEKYLWRTEVDKLSCLQDVSVLHRASRETAEMFLIWLNPSIWGHLNACVVWKNLICVCVCEGQALYKGRKSGFKKRVRIKLWWPEVEEEEMGMWKGKIADYFLCFLLRRSKELYPVPPEVTLLLLARCSASSRLRNPEMRDRRHGG